MSGFSRTYATGHGDTETIRANNFTQCGVSRPCNGRGLFAFLTGAWGFALAGAISTRRELTSVSQHLVPAGVAAGVLAAVPGLIDYVGTVPQTSSGKSRATKLIHTDNARIVIGRTGKT